MEPVIRAVNTVDNGWQRLKAGCLWVLINLLCVGLGVAAYYYGRTSWSLTRDGLSVTGTVVALKESAATEDSGVTYTPVISYEVEGQTYTFTSNVSSDPPAYKVGDPANVIYEATDPSRARVDSWLELWLLPVVLGGSAVIVALVFNVVAVFSLIRRIK
jgi:hypothetical protein